MTAAGRGLGGDYGLRIGRPAVHVSLVSLHTPNTHAGRVAQLILEAERRGQVGIVERARMKAEAKPVRKAD